MKWFLLIVMMFINACASWPDKKITHWNYQLDNYNQRFEKLMQMSHQPLWVIDINNNFFTKEKILQYQKKQNIILAYTNLKELNSNKLMDYSTKIKEMGVNGVYIKIEDKQKQNPQLIKKTVHNFSKTHNENFLIYVANAPLIIEQMDLKQSENYLEMIDGIALEGELFNLSNHKRNKDLARIVQRYKKQNKQILSVEYTVSLSMMNQYRKFVSENDILGLVTDSGLRGLTFLHFIKE